MPVEIESSGAAIRAWVDGVPIEDSAAKQLQETASLPVICGHLAVMPDVHWGMGSTVGSVVPTRAALIPAAVGVDIGCGMCAVRTTLSASDLPDDLSAMRKTIENKVPHGRTANGGEGDRGAWHDPTPEAIEAWSVLSTEYEEIVAKRGTLKAKRCPVHHMGTLGTGNHFVEVCLDEEQRVWIMLHSGSRGIGNHIGMRFIAEALKAAEKAGTVLPNKDLAWLEEGTELFDEYWRALSWAQSFAALNRRTMLSAVVRAMSGQVRPFEADAKVINCHHNYAVKENHFGMDMYITRKGAVSAKLGEEGIIPGSMGARSYIVRGRGNPESYCTCSHGAGRKMSRGAARRTFTVAQHIEATNGVECRKDEGVLDETPMAYKDIDAVMAAQSDLVEITHTLKQVLCVKG